MRHRLFTFSLAVTALIFLTACSGEDGDVADAANATSTTPSNQPEPATTSDIISADTLAGGAAAWKQGNCTMCHSSDGSGNRFGPDLTDAQWNNCDGSIDGIRAILVAGIPTEKFHNTSFAMAMPAATLLVTEQEKLDALAEYVRNLSSKTSGNE